MRLNLILWVLGLSVTLLSCGLKETPSNQESQPKFLALLKNLWARSGIGGLPTV
jgi:hypothetical protein